MKIERELAPGRNLFSGYGDGYVEVNGVRHPGNVAVGADFVTRDWLDGSLESLAEKHLAALAATAPEIVLLGTGAVFRFASPAVLAPLHRAGIGVEVMDTKAACRTYNILLGEGRRVVAALIVD